ncbi:hypothetical protein D9M71_482230 [compost metagenome]
MNRADAAAGKHGIGGLGDHGHVDAYPITFFDAALFKHIGQTADMLVHFTVGNDAGVGRIVAFADDRRLVASGGEVTVDAVIADVKSGTLEPGGLAGLHVTALDAAPRLDPVENFGLVCPESVGVFDGLAVQALIVGLAQLRRFADGIGLGKVADIEHGGVLF